MKVLLRKMILMRVVRVLCSLLLPCVVYSVILGPSLAKIGNVIEVCE